MAITLADRAQINMATGRTEQALEDLQSAIETYSTAITLNPNHGNYHSNKAFALVIRAQILTDAGRSKQALEDLERALETCATANALNPNHELNHGSKASALQIRANIHLDYGRVEQALEDLESAIEAYSSGITLNPIHGYYHSYKANALQNRAQIHMDAGRLEQALEDLERALQAYSTAITCNPNNGDYYSNKANTLITRAEIHMAAGQAEHALEDFESAIKDSSTAITLNPNHGDYHNNRANALITRAQIHMAAGRLEQALEDLDKTLKAFSTAITLNPYIGNYHSNKALALVIRAQILMDAGRLEQALEDLDSGIEASSTAITCNPTNGNYYNNKASALQTRAEIHRAAGRIGQALEDLDKALNACFTAISCNPTLGDYHGNKASTLGARAKIHMVAERLEQALEDSERALEAQSVAITLNPNHGHYHSNKAGFLLTCAQIHMAARRLEQALEDLDSGIEASSTAITLNPKHGHYHINKANALQTRANIYQATGKSDMALAEIKKSIYSYDQALECNPHNASFMLNCSGANWFLLQLLLERNDPAAIFAAQNAVHMKLSAVDIQPVSSSYKEGVALLRQLENSASLFKTISAVETDKLFELGRRFLRHREQFDPEINPDALFNRAVFLQNRAPRQALDLGRQYLTLQTRRKQQNVAEAAALCLSIMVDTLRDNTMAWQFFNGFMAEWPTSSQPFNAGAIVSLFRIMAGTVEHLDHLRGYVSPIFRYLSSVSPSKDMAATFNDLCELIVVSCRIVADSQQDPAGFIVLEREVWGDLREKVGFWKRAGLFLEPGADPADKYERMSGEEAKAVVRELYQQGVDDACRHIISMVEEMVSLFDSLQGTVAERLHRCLLTFKSKSGTATAEESFEERLSHLIASLCFRIAHLHPEAEQQVAPISGGEKFESQSRTQVTQAGEMLTSFKGRQDIDYSPVVMLLAKAVEAEFHAKVVQKIKDTAKYGGLGQLNLSRDPDPGPHEKTNDSWRNLLRDKEPRFLFSDFCKTWEGVCNDTMNLPELTHHICGWLRQALQDTPLIDKAVAAAMREVNSLRNKAVHDSDRKIEEHQALHTWQLCLEPPPEKLAGGILPQLIRVGEVLQRGKAEKYVQVV
jgi:tetratricopeptide (TPR) repeat protein